MQQRRWKEAAEAFGAIARPDGACEMRRRLCANLAELSEYRPEIYGAVIESIGRDNYRIVRGKAGRLTLAAAGNAGGRDISLSRGDDPVSSTLQALSDIKGAWQGGKNLALFGLGDGYVLSTMAACPPAMTLGREQVVFVIEPDAALALANLSLHDFSASDGPIRQMRFRWFVGADWAAQFEREVLADPFLPFPESSLCQSPEAGAIEVGFQQAAEKLLEVDRRQAEQAEAMYRNVSAAELAELFSEHPPRRPRILFLTSRFTTVLQYSTADAAEAMENLGWETRILMEPSAYQSRVKQAMRQMILEFKPDAVFIIDHLRDEYEGAVPPGLPFLSWIQDHLANLCSGEAGASVGVRDFVLTPVGTYFARQHAYPSRQIVDLPNLGRAPKRPANWRSDGLDLAYTSNWSKSTQDVVDELLAQSSATPESEKVAQAVCAEILGVYDRGQWLATLYDVRLAVERALANCGMAAAEAQVLDGLVKRFWDRLNCHLFRHQALEWVARLAERRGLQLGIYGNGWEKHPQLGRFARGFVRPGIELENLVRRTKINLQIETFACFTHPRLLNGLFAGGFFLVRDNPFNYLPLKLLNFICENVDSKIETTADALSAIAPAQRSELQALLGECRALAEQFDAVQLVRNWERSGLIIAGSPPLPHLSDVVFDDERSLAMRVDRFLEDGAMRKIVCEAQRRELEGRLSYEAGLKRACRRIESLLRSESCA